MIITHHDEYILYDEQVVEHTGNLEKRKKFCVNKQNDPPNLCTINLGRCGTFNLKVVGGLIVIVNIRTQIYHQYNYVNTFLNL